MKVRAYVVCSSGLYPVANIEEQIDLISSLECGDILKIKGIGEMRITEFEFKHVEHGETKECNVYLKALTVWQI